jgi:hypothetical protein
VARITGSTYVYACMDYTYTGGWTGEVTSWYWNAGYTGLSPILEFHGNGSGGTYEYTYTLQFTVVGPGGQDTAGLLITVFVPPHANC